MGPDRRRGCFAKDGHCELNQTSRCTILISRLFLLSIFCSVPLYMFFA